MPLKVTVLLLLLCSFSRNHAYNGAAVMINSEEVELQRELKSLNKHPIKTIKSKEGDIIDCIDINKQPALDHPLLKNHRVQTKPQSFPIGITKRSFSAAILELKSGREACPYGTVPIYRIQKEDLVKARSIPNGLTFNMSPAPNTSPAKHAAFVFMQISESGIYHGAGGRLAVYNLSVVHDQTSAATVWAQNGPPDKSNMINIISAGWMVSPQTNGDVLTRLYVYWSVDGGNSTGCYDMLCQGFVQVDRVIAPKYQFSPVSFYGGDQYDFGIVIFKDPQTGNWWLAVTGKDEVLVEVGYWPREILTHLNHGANTVAWGGYVITGTDGISPPMGNGHRPDGDYSHACSFTNIMYIDQASHAYPPLFNARKYVDRPVCYGLEKGPETWKGRSIGYGFTFGGPGGLCDDD